MLRVFFRLCPSPTVAQLREDCQFSHELYMHTKKCQEHTILHVIDKTKMFTFHKQIAVGWYRLNCLHSGRAAVQSYWLAAAIVQLN